MQKLTRAVIRVFDRYMPEPFAFGIVMTMVALVLTWWLTPASAEMVVMSWGNGLASLLPFITQVCLTILFAYALAHLGPVPAYLERLAGFPKTARGAYAFVAVFAGCVSLVAWPLGTILGGLMARQVALAFRHRGQKVHYPLLGGAAFSGFVVWHMGYSGSAPLLVATQGNPMQEQLGGLLPVTQTTLATFNLVTIVVTLACIALVASFLGPAEDELEEIDEPEPSVDKTSVNEQTAPITRPGIASQLENSRWLTSVLGLLLIVYVANWFYSKGIQLDLNIVNWTFLAACLLLTRSASEFTEVLMQAGRAVVPTLLQYPLYAGIMGVMLSTGLVAQLADYFARIGTAETLPLIAFFSGGVINMFIPSGGAQWAVQGPAFLAAAEALGTAPELIVMGVAYGDQWTNIIHPFVVIPLLIMTGLPANKVLSYSFVLFLVATIPLAGGLIFAGFW
ncbi:MAG: TIGR00366 family protein [Gammaproteobacteria bacterium]|mgnify:CR=1 FL=1|jgi:short-chain fatty acids transporter|nr:TIGR00366 family protein [Gammaproteobacteria bacterium]MBT5202639.1 TIGR00366 family protein [Gammaproteobacteria bacterium]MBT5603897.1 TIGR00366 family protein [Gammaproteobacteria bacterium]MBT6244789.1 TIGR00366 family protein [Gammaproteobacteria bacterium]